MSRSPVLRGLAALALFTFAGSCNCGRAPSLTKSESSLALASDVLDFGVVIEGTSKAAKFRVDNTGRAAVGVSAAMKAGSSGEFELGVVPPTVEAQGFIEVLVTYTPVGPGEDEGFVDIQSAQPDTLPLTLRLHGGPIAPAIAFEPDPVDFNPSTLLLETKTAKVKSVGTSALNVRAIGVAANGNPDFSVAPPMLPARLLPGESLNVRVEYARSARDTEGRMEVLSDAQDAGLAWLRLIPDPPAACADGVDNDMDGLTDFPNDPGCQDADDTDEYNPAQCINGATQPCGGNDAGTCTTGIRTCVNSVWGPCSGMGTPMPEVCNNLDDDCDGVIDDGVERPCFSADAGLIGRGACRAGVESCVNGVWTGACSGEVLPVTETCNNVDDDCDGLIDQNVTRACYSGPSNTLNLGQCRGGVQSCTTGAWASNCSGEVTPQPSEVCANGLDETCNGVADEGCPDAGVMCNPNGLFTIDGGMRLTYSCCESLFGGGTMVNIDIDRFNIASAGTVITPLPSQPGATLQPSSPITCPTVGFTATRVIGTTPGPLECVETYQLTGTWTGPNTFVGTYSATFAGAACTSALCGSLPCSNQSWTFSAGR
ncbi:MAG: choice-of-anchor D domain-containing protein [Myxococcota bacterium]